MISLFSTFFAKPHDPFASILEEVRSLYSTFELYKENLNVCISSGKLSLDIDVLFSNIDSVLERIASDLSDMQNCLQVSGLKLDENEAMKRRRDIACYRAKMMDAQHQVKTIRSKIKLPSTSSTTPTLTSLNLTGKPPEPTKRVTFETTTPTPLLSSSSTKKSPSTNEYIESNAVFLQTQKKKTDEHFEEQDKMLDDLLGVTKRLKGISLEINKEIDLHSKILDDLDVKVEKANGKLNKENRNLKRLKETI